MITFVSPLHEGLSNSIATTHPDMVNHDLLAFFRASHPVNRDLVFLSWPANQPDGIAQRITVELDLHAQGRILRVEILLRQIT